MQTGLNSTLNGSLYSFTNGIVVDKRLASQEIKVQMAWANGLCSIAYLTPDEVEKINETLGVAMELIEKDKFEWRIEDEDIHMNLERFCTERLGILGKKMHYGRSRNDLIATTLRLFVRDNIAGIREKTKRLLLSDVKQASDTVDILIPGMTHVQNAQPMRLAQQFLTYAHELKRDIERLESVEKRAMDYMPMGSAACTGTPLNIDLDAVAKSLGFATGPRNSYDGVSDRDFMIEALQVLALEATHISRFCEDIIYQSSSSVGLLKLSKSWSTGSSIMPNKRNPDIPELTRAKMSRVIGAANEGLNLVRVVMHSYGTDLHELKWMLMTSMDEISSCLDVLPPFVKELSVDMTRAKALLGSGNLLATEIADALTTSGMPFRDAYKLVGTMVAKAQELGKEVQELTPQELSAAKIDLPASIDLTKINYDSSVERRQNLGGTAKSRILEQIASFEALR
jgi:argininosuccinate lyase